MLPFSRYNNYLLEIHIFFVLNSVLLDFIPMNLALFFFSFFLFLSFESHVLFGRKEEREAKRMNDRRKKIRWKILEESNEW